MTIYLPNIRAYVRAASKILAYFDAKKIPSRRTETTVTVTRCHNTYIVLQVTKCSTPSFKTDILDVYFKYQYALKYNGI